MAVSVDIKKRFPGFTLDVKFEADNEVFALLGASGCGKSMTLKCIAGIVKPDEGRIVLDGVTLFDSERRINLAPQRRKVGLLFQNYALFPNMTVERNVLSGMRRDRVKSREHRAREIFDAFYLTEQRGLYPPQLSGGQQQRAALARIIAGQPRILMLDEPLSALDGYIRRQLERELTEILEQYGGTVILVSHDMDEVYRMCGNVCVIDGGKSERVTSVNELFADPRTLSAARLSGCGNFSRAVRTGARTVFASDWKAELTCAHDVPDDVRYIGVRSGSVSPSVAENVITCVVNRITDDVSCTVVELLIEHAAPQPDFARITMELPKGCAYELRVADKVNVGFRAEDVLLLR